jgi:hypothetical protein
VSAINLQFRPDDYWDFADPLSAILTNIKGQNRRQMARDFAAGTASQLLGDMDSGLLEDTLGKGTRRKLGRIHPSWMGGEYLPGYLPGEIEIARVVLASTTQDVISIRARRRRGRSRLLYRVVDEYQDFPGIRWNCRRKSSLRPLTLGQLINLIDHAEHADLNPNGKSLTNRLREIQEGCEPGELVDFVTVESVFYPGLSEYYRAQARRWVEAQSDKIEWGEDDE